ncbi:hypothetical protein JW721_05100 [Candidatus Micrarchaeota archaeon]|nr:hypothetical protein [Candidatus Micrarchaeota archaeon]
MMREVLLLLLLACAGYCAECEAYNGSECVLWKDPPLSNLTSHNAEIGESLMENDGLVAGANLTFEAPAAVDMRVLSAFPMVDNRIPSNATGILWTWGEANADDSIIQTEEEGCTHDYVFSHPEYGIYDYNWSAVMYFTFAQQTRRVVVLNESAIGGVIVEPEAVVEIPFAEFELEAANGTENLSVRIEWSFYYAYSYLDNPGGTCEGSSSVVNDSITIRGNRTMEFIVEGGGPEFFTVRPALGEQWYLSNHFDNLIFSRKSIYKARILNGSANATAGARIRNFTLVRSSEQGLESVWYIFSHPAQDFAGAVMGGYEGAYWANPLVESAFPFSHLYEVNHSYEAWGPHLMEIEVRDFFGGTYSYSRELVSRKATRGGISETGEEAGGPLFYRPGTGEEGWGELSRFEIPPSTILLVFLIFAIWAYAYYRRERKKDQQ